MSQKKKTERVAVIGSGFGGLSLAIRLQAAGFETHVFEACEQPGGRAAVFREQGFTFDAGPTVITAPHSLEELFTLTGRHLKDYVELMPVTPFYRLCWHDGDRFDYTNDEAELFRQIRARNPRDVEGYKRFLAYSKEVFDKGYTELAATPFLNLWSMVKVAPELARLGAHRSVYDVVSRYLEDEKLREAFSFHSLLVGGNPFSTSAIYTLIHFLERKWGVFFPKGGTGALVSGLVRYFDELGGHLHLDSPVERILTENGKVTGVVVHGEKMEFQAVASNGDVYRTYSQLLKHEPLARPRTEALSGSHYSMSLFLIYFGTRKRYPGLAHHNVLFGPRYRGLLDDIFKNPRGLLPDDFSLYLHVPTLTDESLAPPGHECFYVLAPVAHKGHLAVDWKKEAPAFADKILAYMEERYMPGLRENLVVKKLFTPDDFERRLGSHLGSAFSLEPRLTQSAYFRQHNKDARIPGLYFVGAGTHPGAGVPGVVSSAKATAGLMLGDLHA